MPHLHIVLSAREQAHLKAQAEAAGLSVSALVRSLIMGAEVKPKPPAEWPALLRQMSGIGNNINQIARAANADGYVPQADIDRITEMQARLWRLVKSL